MVDNKSILNKSLDSIAQGSIIIFFGLIIGYFIGIIYSVLIARILGPTEFGLYSLGISILSIAAIITRFGLPSALVQFIPYNIKNNQLNNVKIAINFSLLYSSVSGVIIAGILFYFSQLIAVELFHTPELEGVIQILSIGLIFWSIHDIFISLTQAFKKPEYYILVEEIGIKIFRLVIFVIFAYLEYKLIGALFAYISSMLFGCIILAYIWYKKFHPSLQNSSNYNECEKKTVIRDLISLAAPLFLAGFSLLFVNYSDQIILGVYMKPQDVGIYAASITIASLTLFIFTAFSFNFRPIITECYSLNDITMIQKIFSSTTKWIFLLTFPIVIYLFFYSRDVLNFLYGFNYVEGYLALAILAVGFGMTGFTGLTGELLISIKMPRLNLISEIIGSFSNVILNLILIPYFGIIGAALGTSISLSLKNLTSLAFVYRTLKIQPYTINFIKIMIITIVEMFVISSFINQIVSFSFLAIIPIFLVLYFVLLYYLKVFDDYDLSIIQNLSEKILKFNRDH